MGYLDIFTQLNDNTRVATPLIVESYTFPLEIIEFSKFYPELPMDLVALKYYEYLSKKQSLELEKEKTPYDKLLSAIKLKQVEIQEKEIERLENELKALQLVDGMMKFISPSSYVELFSGKDLNAGLEFAADILLDPTSYFSLGLTPFVKKVGPKALDISLTTLRLLNKTNQIASNPIIINQLHKNNSLSKRIFKDASYESAYNTPNNILIKILNLSDINDYFKGLKTNVPNGDIYNIGGYYNGRNKELIVVKDRDGLTSTLTPFHEGLHAIGYGVKTDPRLTLLKIQKIIDTEKTSGLSDNSVKYFLSNFEAPVHYLLLGEMYGIPIGAKYPGVDKFKEIIENYGLSGAPVFTKLNNDRDYKRLWDAITGVYFKNGGKIICQQ